MSALRSNSETNGGVSETWKQNQTHQGVQQNTDAEKIAVDFLSWMSEIDETQFNSEDEEKLNQMLAALAEASPKVSEFDVDRSWETFCEKNQVLI